MNFKTALANVIGTAGLWAKTQEVARADVESYLNSNNMCADGWTKAAILTQCNLPTNYLTYTPWRGLAGSGSVLTNDYGWQGIKEICNLLLILHSDGDNQGGASFNSGAGWAKGVSFGSNTFGDNISGTTWPQIESLCDGTNGINGYADNMYQGAYSKYGLDFKEIGSTFEERRAEKKLSKFYVTNVFTESAGITNGVDIPIWLILKSTNLAQAGGGYTNIVTEYSSCGDSYYPSNAAGAKMTVMTNNSHARWGVTIASTNVFSNWPAVHPDNSSGIKLSIVGYAMGDGGDANSLTNNACIVYDWRGVLKYKGD